MSFAWNFVKWKPKHSNSDWIEFEVKNSMDEKKTTTLTAIYLFFCWKFLSKHHIEEIVKNKFVFNYIVVPLLLIAPNNNNNNSLDIFFIYHSQTYRRRRIQYTLYWFHYKQKSTYTWLKTEQNQTKEHTKIKPQQQHQQQK